MHNFCELESYVNNNHLKMSELFYKNLYVH